MSIVLQFCGMIKMVRILVLIYIVHFWIKNMQKLLIGSAIQKLDYMHFSPIGFVVVLKPNVFEDLNYKRWHAKAVLWLMAMNFFHASKSKPKGTLTLEHGV